jgi:hypothetical protein
VASATSSNRTRQMHGNRKRPFDGFRFLNRLRITGNFSTPRKMKSPTDQLRRLRDELRLRLDMDETFVAWLAADAAVRQIEKSLGMQLRERPTVNYAQVPQSIAVVQERKVADRVVGMLVAKGVPRSTTQIFGDLVTAGVVFHGTVPIKNLRSMLSKDKRLRSVATPTGPAWWLSDNGLSFPETEPNAVGSTNTNETAPLAPTNGAVNGSGSHHPE